MPQGQIGHQGPPTGTYSNQEQEDKYTPDYKAIFGGFWDTYNEVLSTPEAQKSDIVRHIEITQRVLQEQKDVIDEVHTKLQEAIDIINKYEMFGSHGRGHRGPQGPRMEG